MSLDTGICSRKTKRRTAANLAVLAYVIVLTLGVAYSLGVALASGPWWLVLFSVVALGLILFVVWDVWREMRG